MAELITTGEISALVPGLRDPWLSLFTDAANSVIRRKVPTVMTDPGTAAEARLIVARAIRRVANSKEWLSSESAGPFSVSYVTAGRGLFDATDLSLLEALVASQRPSGGPSGHFPPARDYSRLFANPGRRYPDVY